ncbi:MAG: FAD binding domain-containing protein [Myxococcales bacterium]|nr:FAD binding domain-containing protein [Myxococcales bacterium]
MTAYARPESLEALVRALSELGPGARVLAGGTDLMLSVRAGKSFPALINVSRVPELSELAARDGALWIGGGVTVARLLGSAEVHGGALALWQAADRFASPLVRSRATVGGNLCNASPAADLALALLALDAEVHLVSAQGRRALPVSDFMLGPGKSALAQGEVLTAVRVPLRPGLLQRFIKSGTRPALEIAAASVAVALSMEHGVVVAPRIACGAVAPVPVRARSAERALERHALTPERIEEAACAAATEVRPIDDVRASALYRRRLVAAFVRRSLEELAAASTPGNREATQALGRGPPTKQGGRPAHGQLGLDSLAERSASPAAPAGDEVPIVLVLNGRRVEARVSPTMALLELVRDRFQLSGSKLGCGEGECGACAMLLDGEPVLGCLTPAVDTDGREVRTVEGLRDGAQLGKLQQAFVREGAVQCGFCTPGMLVAASGLLARHPNPTEEQICRGLEGNLCRCTGYVAVIEAVRAS